jgi:hypothetical protein
MGSPLNEVNSILEELRARMFDALTLQTYILRLNECKRETPMDGWNRLFVMPVMAKCQSLLIEEITKNGSQSFRWKT